MPKKKSRCRSLKHARSGCFYSSKLGKCRSRKKRTRTYRATTDPDAGRRNQVRIMEQCPSYDTIMSTLGGKFPSEISEKLINMKRRQFNANLITYKKALHLVSSVVDQPVTSTEGLQNIFDQKVELIRNKDRTMQSIHQKASEEDVEIIIEVARYFLNVFFFNSSES